MSILLGCCCARDCLRQYFPAGYRDQPYRLVGTGSWTLPSTVQWQAGQATDAINIADFRTVSVDPAFFGSAWPLSTTPLGEYRLSPTSYYYGGDIAPTPGTNRWPNLTAPSTVAVTYPAPAVFNGHTIDFSDVKANMSFTSETPFPQCAASGSASNQILAPSVYLTDDIYSGGSITLELTWPNVLLGPTAGPHDYYYDTFDVVGSETWMRNSELAGGEIYPNLRPYPTPSINQDLLSDAWQTLGFALGKQNTPTFPTRVRVTSEASEYFDLTFSSGTAELQYLGLQTNLNTVVLAERTSTDYELVGDLYQVPDPVRRFNVAAPTVQSNYIKLPTTTFNSQGGAAYYSTVPAALTYNNTVTLAGGWRSLATIKQTSMFSISPTVGQLLSNYLNAGIISITPIGWDMNASGTMTGTSTSWSEVATQSNLPLTMTRPNWSFLSSGNTVSIAPPDTVGISRVSP